MQGNLEGLISLIIPVRNEEKNIQRLCDRVIKSLEKYEWEIIFVEDSSTDTTRDAIFKAASIDKRIKAVFLTRSFGTQEAFTAGITISKGDHIVMMDGDLQHPPEVIPELIKHYSQGYDVVYAKRSTKEPFFKDISSKVLNKLMRLLSDYAIDLNTSIFRIFSRRVADTILSMKENGRILTGMIAWTGFKSMHIYFEEDSRKYGVTKFSFARMLALAVNSLISFSIKPLRFAVFIGLISSCLSFFVGAYYITKYFIFGISVAGFASIIVSMFFIAGLILFFMGIIGEYIGSIFIEIKGRPLYIIDKTINIKIER